MNLAKISLSTRKIYSVIPLIYSANTDYELDTVLGSRNRTMDKSLTFHKEFRK